jgi:aminoglycoside 3-N-acetyltransferase
LGIDLKNLNPPFLIHSDVFTTINFIKGKLNQYRNVSDSFNKLHLEFLYSLLDEKNLIFPAFNYDFPKTEIFNLRDTPSQVGALTNYVLSRGDFLRSETPIFSFLTKSKFMPLDSMTPFLKGSVFDYLHDCDGSVLFYGTDISSCTYLHYVESKYGPPYRYDKKFNGKIILDNTSNDVSVKFHVRPLGLDFDYNWDFLLGILRENNVIVDLGRNFFGIKVRDISNIWGEVIKEAPTKILSKECANEVQNKLDTIGRRFLISDFEG